MSKTVLIVSWTLRVIVAVILLQTLYFKFSAAPVIGDFEGDGKTDIAVFRASEGRWLLRDSATGMLSDVAFGPVGDVQMVPLAEDYDGDGKDDLMVWRASEGAGYVRRSVDQSTQPAPWGPSATGRISRLRRLRRRRQSGTRHLAGDQSGVGHPVSPDATLTGSWSVPLLGHGTLHANHNAM